MPIMGRRATPRIIAALAATAMVFALIAIFPAPAAKADTSLVALWQMNEGSGASTMNDSGPYNLDGHIGDDVITGASYGGATGYRWLYKRPNEPPAEPERNVRVDHDSRLNPGSGDFAVEFRFRTTQNFGNVVQKGQSHSNGGYFKFENPQGKIRCLMKDGTGYKRSVRSPFTTNDGQWHTIRCVKEGNRLKLYIDGDLVRNAWHSLGSIANNKDLAIGGKLACDQQTVTCDYFTGDIDYVRIEKEGEGSPPPPPPPPPSGGGDITFVDSNTDTDNTQNHTVNVPNVQAGDFLVLFATGAASDVSINNPTGVAGWSSLGTASENQLITRVWTRFAQSGDSGDQITVSMSKRSKGNLTVVAYRGVVDVGDWDSDNPPGSSSVWATPVSQVSASDSFAVSFWVHRDSETNGLDPLDSVAVRESDSGSGGGHTTVLLADSGGSISGSSYGDREARADGSSSKANTWTIILES